MSLRSPSSGIKWKDYRISTPTFDLTPVEKPDFSPFLIHMTGKKQLVHILKGEKVPEKIKIKPNHGYIRSSIPAFDGAESHYNSRVVCFTESPIFSLDFFRYRSFARWNADQQFGIGFSKGVMVDNYDVRPVIYLDSTSNSTLLRLCNTSEKDDQLLVDKKIDMEVKEFLKRIKPLLFPLLENEVMEGYMWEREWRYPYDTGLMFNHSLIKVICCPKEERKEIEAILHPLLPKIEIIESWREYDEVTNYLKRRKEEYDENALDNIDKIKDLAALRQLKEQNDRTFNSLEQYYSVFRESVDKLEGNNIKGLIESMQKKSGIIAKKIEKIEAEEKAKLRDKKTGLK